MHPTPINPAQLQQILQLQQMQRQQQFQANNRHQIQIFASPPNAQNNDTHSNNPGQTQNSNNNSTPQTNSIQFQPLQILQMAQNNANVNTAQNTQTAQTPNISFATAAIPNFNAANRIAIINQLRQRQSAQQNINSAPQTVNVNGNVNTNIANVVNVSSGDAGHGSNMRQSIQQQMVTFIQQLQQFPPLFQHLQNNPHVLAQLLQQFKWKQEQNARDQMQQMQHRQMSQTNAQMPMPQSINGMNMAGVGGLIRSLQAQRQLQQQSQALSASQNQIHINTAQIQNHCNANAPPALEQEKDNKSSDVIVLGGSDNETNTHVSNASANANVSNALPPLITNTNNANKTLDFSQLKGLKGLKIPTNIETLKNNKDSPLKRPFSSAQTSNHSHLKSEPMSKRRRLNNDKSQTIRISSDDTLMKDSASSKPKKKKKRGRKSKAEKKEYQTRSKQRKRDEIVSLLSDDSFKSMADIINETGKDQSDVITESDFMSDPLISEITQRMAEIAKIANERRMATPEMTGDFGKGMDVLWQAIDELDCPKTANKSDSKVRKNGELFVTDHCQGKDQKKDGISKIVDILGLNYSLFKLNESSTLMASAANDRLFKHKLSLLCTEFSEYYKNGLLNVFKTCTNEIYTSKFKNCKQSLPRYMSVWSDIFQTHFTTEIEAWLSHAQIKQSIGVMFAVMDHLFSYDLFTYLTETESERKEESVPLPKQEKLACEEWIPIHGNPLFKSVESDCAKLKESIVWLFEYWKKVLTAAQEPMKCLCRSYLIRSVAHPFKMVLYAMIKQTGYSHKSVVLKNKLKSKSMSPNTNTRNAQNKNQKKIMQRSKTPPNNHNHFIRKNQSQSVMSVNAILGRQKQSNKSNTNNTIPSSSVCGKTFINALQCAEHSKDCQECKHRIVSISGNN